MAEWITNKLHADYLVVLYYSLMVEATAEPLKSAVSMQSRMAMKWDNLFCSWPSLFRLLRKVLKHSNWHFICSYGSVAAETAMKPGSDCEYLMTLRGAKKMEREWDLKL